MPKPSQLAAAPPPIEPRLWPKLALGRGLLVLGWALLPSLMAIATTTGFSTQDGPAHVFSARILNASLGRDSPFAATFAIRWELLPNWAGHGLTMLILAIWSPEVANRVLAATTLVTLASAVVYLRHVVVGHEGIEVAAVLAALLALNVTWLLGFTSFLLGAALAPVTLAFWWARRDRWHPSAALGLGLLLVLGYFCHPISLGVTLGGLIVLVALAPGSARLARAGWTGVSGLPLIPLLLNYRALTRAGGGFEPVWDHWSHSIAGLVSQVGWVDPLSLAAKTTTPFQVSTGFVPAALLAPALWCGIGLGILVVHSWKRRDNDRTAWFVMAGGLILVGLASPDTLGIKHGHFLPQRIVLLGLTALVPWLNLDLGRRQVQIASALLVVALLIQSTFVWDYARTCHRRVTPFLEVASQFKPGTRVGTLLNKIRGRFRANPSLHADGLIAAQTDSVFWTNYETAQYYFPVKVRADVVHPGATGFEEVAIRDEPRDAARRARLWRSLLHDHAAQLDQIVEWQFDPDLDAITARQYRMTYQVGLIRVWSRVVPQNGPD